MILANRESVRLQRTNSSKITPSNRLSLVIKYMIAELLILFLSLVSISSATVIDFQETYWDYNGNSHKYNEQNLGNYPLYSVTDNDDNYTISRFNISKDIPKQYSRNGITFNISYQFYPDRIVPSFQIDSYSQISNFVVKQNATAWYLPLPWKASQYISFTDDLIDMGVFKRTTKVTVLDSNGTEYQVLPKVTSNQIRLWFNPQTYSSVIYPLTITENTITVTNATTQGWTTVNVSLNGSAWTGQNGGGLRLNYLNDSNLNMSNLVAAWNFDSESGTLAHNVMNESGFVNITNQGILTNMNSGLNNCTVSCSGWNSSGKIGNALVFDGVDDYVNIGTPINLTSNFSVSLWFNLNSNTTWQNMALISISNNGKRFVIEIADGTNKYLRAGVYNGTTYKSKSKSNYNSWNTWNNIVFTWDNNSETPMLYLNTTSLAGTIAASATSTVNSIIGARSLPTGYFVNGSIDEVIIYDRVLSLSEVRVLYNTSMRTIAMPLILNQTASIGNVINRTRIVYTGQDSINNASIYARQNGTTAWSLLQANVTSNAWYSISSQFNAMDFAVELQGNGSNTPFFTSIEWDESSNVSSIINLTSTSSTSWINWTWTNPTDVNFASVMIYVDGAWIENVTSNYYIRYYEADRYHTLSTRTVSTIGVVNDTWINSTGHTLLITGGGIGSGGSSSGGTWVPEKPKYYTPDTNTSNSSNLSKQITKVANQIGGGASNTVDIVNENGSNIIILSIITLSVIVVFIKNNGWQYRFNKKK